jgi:hypothetical protein
MGPHPRPGPAVTTCLLAREVAGAAFTRREYQPSTGPVKVPRTSGRILPRGSEELSSERKSHHRTCGIGTADLDEARGGEHRHGPGVKGRSRHMGGREGGCIDGMPLDRRRTVVAGECHGSLQQGSANAGSPVLAIDGKTGHPPDSGVIAREHLGEGPIAADAGKRMPGPNSGPSNRAAANIGDEPGRYHSVRDLLVQRTPIVRRHFRRRGFRGFRTEEKLAPAPRGIFTPPTEHRDHVAPPISSRGLHLYGHGLHDRAWLNQRLPAACVPIGE